MLVKENNTNVQSVKFGCYFFPFKRKFQIVLAQFLPYDKESGLEPYPLIRVGPITEFLKTFNDINIKNPEIMMHNIKKQVGA